MPIRITGMNSGYGVHYFRVSKGAEDEDRQY